MKIISHYLLPFKRGKLFSHKTSPELTDCEKIKDMDRQLPYEKMYKGIACWRKVENIFLWGTFICQILLLVYQIDYVSQLLPKCGFNFLPSLNSIFIVGYSLLYFFVEIIRQPKAASERRKGFIDNSLGSKLLDGEVQNYYDNDSIGQGLYKMLVNCYENCFFTYNIIKAMKVKMILKNIILLLVFFLGFAYFGIKDNTIAIPFLQLLLSSLFLETLVYHFVFLCKLKKLYERFEQIFSASKLTENKIIQDAVYMVLEYEVALAYNKSPNSDSVYKKFRERLTKEWESKKQKYGIG